MPRLSSIMGALILMLVCSPTFGKWQFAAPDPQLGYAKDHLIIKFRGESVQKLSTVHGDELHHALLRELDIAGAEIVDPFPDIDPGPGNRFHRFKLLSLPAHSKPLQVLERLQGHPLIDYVELDHIGSGGVVPSDPNYVSQYHLPKISAPAAWDITTGSTNVIVAVLDSGLTDAVGEFSGRTVAGYDFVNNDSDPADDHGHGTAVAAVATANANNGIRIAGVDWRCRVMPVKVLDANNSGFYSWWASGVDWAVSNGCKVINLSAGGASSNTTLTRSIQNAISNGVIFVTITHNDSANIIRYPGNLTNCITVGATTSSDVRSSFSNYGAQIDLVAPGSSIGTVSSPGTFSTWNGTSFSAPQVSGVAALLASLNPNITHEQAQTLLCAGAQDQVGGTNDPVGFDTEYGWGRLNAHNTLLLAQTQMTATRSGTNIQFSWRSPSNAGSKKPYRMAYANSLLGTWTTLSNANFSYGSTNTTWIDNGSETGGLATSNRFYRITVVLQ